MKRSQAQSTSSAADAPTTETVTIPHDPVNEQIVIAAAMTNDELRDKLLRKLRPDAFLTPLHRQVWAAFAEMGRQKLAYDPATVQQLLGIDFDISFLVQLGESRPDLPPNLDYHVENVLWDQARFKAVCGPLAQFLEAVKNNRTDPARVRALAKQISAPFEGYGERKFLRDGPSVVKEAMDDIRSRIGGNACFPTGLDGLDYYEQGHEKEGQNRLIPGMKPGKLSLIVGVSGGGKSLFTCKLIGCLAKKQKKKLLVGAWEMTPAEIMELVACQVLNISRNDASTGRLTEEMLYELENEMNILREHIQFMEIPFFRETNERRSNEKNLDLIQGYIADTGCDVFVADLFKRALAHTDPDDEEHALVRVQSMFQELHVHGILVQQMRLKDLESRADKRPTREGIKGSGAWIEIPDNIFGLHRPGLWKNIPDDHLDCILLKQRYGKWPETVQFVCDVTTGFIGNGKTVTYNKGEEVEDEKPEGFDLNPENYGKRSKRGS